jgi:O-antigen/teichoic acid export membrane protein
LRNAVRGLSEAVLIAGVLVILVTIRAAEPVMTLIGGHAFRPAGDVLRIQVVALLFIALYQLWTAALLALGRQRDLIATNAMALAGVAIFAAILVPAFGARGGAAASVLGDAMLASLIYWRLSRATGSLRVRRGFLLRVAGSAAVAGAVLAIPVLPDLLAAALAGVVFLGVGQLIGMIPGEVRAAFALRRLLPWRSARGI